MANNPRGFTKLRQSKKYDLRFLAEMALLRNEAEVAAQLRQADKDINKMLRLLARFRDAYHFDGTNEFSPAAQAGVVFDVVEFLENFVEDYHG